MGLIWFVAAIVWGTAEATLFFTVPDVLLTLAVVKHGIRPALRLMPLVIVGALLGGTIMHLYAGANLDSARATVDAVPLISPEMIAKAGEQMKGEWLTNMIWGALSGLPYKVYAVESAPAGLSLPIFLLGSIVARIPRFLLTICFAGLVMAALRRFRIERIATWLWAIMWITFYIFFYLVMPW